MYLPDFSIFLFIYLYLILLFLFCFIFFKMRTVLHTLVFTVYIIELLYIIEFSLDIMNIHGTRKTGILIGLI